MKILATLVLLLFASPWGEAQGNFRFTKKRGKTIIPFELVNNLIIVPVKLNGVELNFLVDSGVEETILFSLEESEDIAFENVEKVKLRGLGQAEPIEGLKSKGNRLEFRDMYDENHLVYIVLDQGFNFSSQIGIPVNGIIGYQLFKDNLVEINYDRKRLIIYHDAGTARRKIARKMKSQPISLELRKPYVYAGVLQQNDSISAKLLVDTGCSDAVWLFRAKSDSIELPARHFEDFLGRGFSGEVHGERGRIPNFAFSGFSFDGPVAAFPDSASIHHVKMVKGRLGSIGAEILKRFTVVFDYSQNQLFLRKGRKFHDAFHYNMSGLEIEHAGLQWIKETVELKTAVSGMQYDGSFNRKMSDFQYKFELKPVYRVMSVRDGSPAAEAGLLVGDMIVSVNGKRAYRYSLQQINSLLREAPDKEVSVEIDRSGKRSRMSFRLRRML